MSQYFERQTQNPENLEDAACPGLAVQFCVLDLHKLRYFLEDQLENHLCCPCRVRIQALLLPRVPAGSHHREGSAALSLPQPLHCPPSIPDPGQGGEFLHV